MTLTKMPSGRVALPRMWTAPFLVKPRSMAGGWGGGGRGFWAEGEGLDGAGGSGCGGLVCGCGCAAGGTTVHGGVGEGVGGFVFVAEGVGDLEGFEAGDAVVGFLPEGLEVGGVDLVAALDLADHELGVGDDFEAGVMVLEGPGEDGEEAGVLGVVVGAGA